jgi:cell division protein FtsL
MTTKDIEKTVEENGEEEILEQEEPKAPRKKGSLAKKIFVIIAVCFCAYAAFTIVYDKAEIAKLRSETSDISKQIDEEKALNDEYSRMLDSGEKEYMKKIAIDKLGYAFPEERRFYIVNQNK